MRIYHVKRARKDYPEEEIKKGDEYFYCHPKGKDSDGKKRKVKRRTKEALQSWITSYAKSHRGEFASNMEDWEARIENGDLEGLREEVEEFLDEKSNNLDNIPWELQEGHILNEQIEELEQFLNEIPDEEEE